MEKDEKSPRLVVYNDSVNTFDHVVTLLQNICGHTYLQAYQCAVIIHNTGSCTVKEKQQVDVLSYMKGKLLENGLKTEIIY